MAGFILGANLLCIIQLHLRALNFIGNRIIEFLSNGNNLTASKFILRKEK